MKRIFSPDQLTVRASFGMLEGHTGPMGEYYRSPVNVKVANRSDEILGDVAVVLMCGTVLGSAPDLACPSPLFGEGNPVVRRTQIRWRLLPDTVGSLAVGEEYHKKIYVPDVMASRLGIFAVSGTYSNGKLRFESVRSCEPDVTGVDGAVIEHVTRFGIPYNETQGFVQRACKALTCRFLHQTRLGQFAVDKQKQAAALLHNPERAVRAAMTAVKNTFSFPY